jgi:N-acetylmuramoyl-L-alanine amidase
MKATHFWLLKYTTIRTLLFLVGLLNINGALAQSDTLHSQNTRILMGKTQGVLPYLKYGPGMDRLGGAKMTYLDTAIVLQVVDSLKEDFIVRLSPNHHAFIPKENVKLCSDLVPVAYNLTSSWVVYGDERQDYVSISLDERLPYQSIQMTDPSRIVVDIYGATGNTNWITQLKTSKEIANVYHEQMEDKVFRVTIQLKHRQNWGYSVYYKNKTLLIKVKRQPENLYVRHLKIAIDAGHGGTSTGATGVKTRVEEKKCNLQVAKYLEKELRRAGAEVILTRNEDIDVSMVDRITQLREANPDLLVSIHHNGSSNLNAKGVSTYYRYIGFKPLSVNILNRMLDLGLNDAGNVGSFNFSLSGPTEYPNCLVEVAFMSNEDDEKRINDPHFQKAVAKKIRQGVTDWVRTARRDR